MFNFIRTPFAISGLICIAAILSSVSASSKEGPCEEIVNTNWTSIRLLNETTSVLSLTCHLWGTVVDSNDFLITSARNETVEGFFAQENKNLEYLPTNLGEKFPNLLFLATVNCSIKEITKESFKGLSLLRNLYLHSNQIEKIDDDTFDYISAIQLIALSK